MYKEPISVGGLIRKPLESSLDLDKGHNGDSIARSKGWTFYPGYRTNGKKELVLHYSRSFYCTIVDKPSYFLTS